MKNNKKLTEGTRNFGSMEYLPLLVFDVYYEYDLDAAQYDSKYPLLSEEDIRELQTEIDLFNERTKHRAYELSDGTEQGEDDYYALEDIIISIEPGYYDGGYLWCYDKMLDQLSKEEKEKQLGRFKEFFKSLKERYGLLELGVVGTFSNGETIYTKIDEDCAIKKLSEAEYDDEFDDVIENRDEVIAYVEDILRGKSKYGDTFVSKEAFDEIVEEACEYCFDTIENALAKCGETDIEELKTTIRGNLYGWETIFEGKLEGGLIINDIDAKTLTRIIEDDRLTYDELKTLEDTLFYLIDDLGLSLDELRSIPTILLSTGLFK